jgi:5-methylcytosine-specific restriction endonuclease McrA
VTAPKNSPPPRHRPRLRGPQFAAIRLTVCAGQHYRCLQCGEQFDPPDDYDGSFALHKIIPHEVTPRNPSRLRVIRLEMDHVNNDPMRPGPRTAADFQGLCSPCNRAKPEEAS